VYGDKSVFHFTAPFHTKHDGFVLQMLWVLDQIKFNFDGDYHTWPALLIQGA
jgi:hypothetical protein